MESAPYAVVSSGTRIEAWSTIRLPFEPKGWLRDYREELRSALRMMEASGDDVLLAEYATPDDSFADLENVVLYNIGSGSLSHLCRHGLMCRRIRSVDQFHRVTYSLETEPRWVEFNGSVLAHGSLAESVRDNTPLAWWAAFRDRLLPECREHGGLFAIGVELGRAYRGAGIASLTKPLLDGLVSALHAHDGSSPEVVTASLGEVGDPARLWTLLNSEDGAILGRRRLVRPHGSRIAWNPADELCGAFSVVRGPGQDAISATVTAMDPSAPFSSIANWLPAT